MEGLVQLTTGGPNHIYHGGLLYSQIRHFDPVRRRTGLPPDVAALVDRVTDDGIEVVLSNLHPSEARTLVIQAGAFGEHRFDTATTNGVELDVSGKHLQVELAPGALGRLRLSMSRFVNRPTYAFPWQSSVSRSFLSASTGVREMDRPAFGRIRRAGRASARRDFAPGAIRTA